MAPSKQKYLTISNRQRERFLLEVANNINRFASSNSLAVPLKCNRGTWNYSKGRQIFTR